MTEPTASPGPAPAPTAGASEPKPAKGRGIKPLLSLKAHRRVAVVAASLVVLLGIPYAWLKGRSLYSSSALLQISPRFAKNLEVDQELELQSNTQYREFVQQQVRTVARYDVVSAALDGLGPLRSAWQLPGESPRRAAERLQVALAVVPVPDTYMIRVSLYAPEKKGLAEVVNAVVDAYVRASHSEEIFGADKRIDSLRKQRADLLAEIQARTDRRTAIGRELGITGFSTSTESNAYDKLLQNSREALDAAARRRIEAQSKLVAVDAEARRAQEAAPGRGGGNARVFSLDPDIETSPLAAPGSAAGRSQAPTAPPPAASAAPDPAAAMEGLAWNMVAMDNALMTLRSNLLKRRAELLVSTSGLKPDHPGRQAAERELKEIEAELAAKTQETYERARKAVLGQRKAEAYETSVVEKELAAMTERRRSEAGLFSNLYNEAVSISADIERSRKRLDQIDNRIDFLSLESRAPGFVRVVQRALPPDLPSGGGRRKLLVMVLGAALAVGLVLPIAVDLLDPRIHAANDAERLLGFPPLGWIVDRTDDPTRAFALDQLRRLAVRVERDAREHGAKVYAFASAKPDEGVTTLVFDLARALSDLGHSPLVVEANAFLPSGAFGPPGPAGGVSELLLSGGDPLAAVVAGADGEPDRIPVGAVSPNGCLPRIAGLPALLAAVVPAYDVILVDTPPLLLSADAEIVLSAASVAVLVVEAESTVKSVLGRAAKTLERLTPRAVGAIVTRVRVYEGGGYYREALDEFTSRRRNEVSRIGSPWLWD